MLRDTLRRTDPGTIGRALGVEQVDQKLAPQRPDRPSLPREVGRGFPAFSLSVVTVASVLLSSSASMALFDMAATHRRYRVHHG
jgi:hypothetical protein